jgi:hypothetical protein
LLGDEGSVLGVGEREREVDTWWMLASRDLVAVRVVCRGVDEEVQVGSEPEARVVVVVAAAPAEREVLSG